MSEGNEFGKKIKQYREFNKLSTRQFVCQMLLNKGNMSSGYLSQIENKGKIPAVENICKMAKIFKCSKKQFIELIELAKKQKIDNYINKTNKKFKKGEGDE